MKKFIPFLSILVLASGLFAQGIGTLDGASNNASTGATLELRPRTAIRIFPNPPTEYFQLEDNDVVARIELFNIIGNRVAIYTVNAPGEKYPVADLPRGLYLVRMIDRNGQILFTQRFSKVNP